MRTRLRKTWIIIPAVIAAWIGGSLLAMPAQAAPVQAVIAAVAAAEAVPVVEVVPISDTLETGAQAVTPIIEVWGERPEGLIPESGYSAGEGYEPIIPLGIGLLSPAIARPLTLALILVAATLMGGAVLVGYQAKITPSTK